MEPKRGLRYLGFASRSERRDVEAPPGERTKNPSRRPVRIFIAAELAHRARNIPQANTLRQTGGAEVGRGKSGAISGNSRPVRCAWPSDLAVSWGSSGSAALGAVRLCGDPV